MHEYLIYKLYARYAPRQHNSSQTNKTRKQNIQRNTSKEITTTLFVLTKKWTVRALTYTHPCIHTYMCIGDSVSPNIQFDRTVFASKYEQQKQWWTTWLRICISWLFNCVRFTKETHLFIYVWVLWTHNFQNMLNYFNISLHLYSHKWLEYILTMDLSKRVVIFHLLITCWFEYLFLYTMFFLVTKPMTASVLINLIVCIYFVVISISHE